MMLFGVCLYGGFFNAGLGIIILSYLALAGFSDIHAMNGIKLLVSSAVSLIAIALFVVDGAIAGVNLRCAQLFLAHIAKACPVHQCWTGDHHLGRCLHNQADQPTQRNSNHFIE